MVNALEDIAISDGVIIDTIWRVRPLAVVNDIFSGWCEFPDEYEQEPGEMCLERLVEKIIS